MTMFEGLHEVPVQSGAPAQGNGNEGYVPPHPTTPIPSGEIQEQLEQAAYQPDQMPTEPAPTRRALLLRGSVLRRAGAAVAGTALAGAALASALFGGDRAIAGTPSAAGAGGGNAGTEAPTVPGPDQDESQSPEKESGVVNLCEKFSLEDIGEWAFGTRSVIPEQEGLAPDDRITCNGAVPTNTDVPIENFVATGEWEFPQEGRNSFPVDLITIQVVKDKLPDSSSYFELQSRSYSESPKIQTIGDVQVIMLSGGGTTLARVPQPNGDIMDVRFSIKLPQGMGGGSELPYPALHKGEVAAMPAILNDLNLAK